MASYLGDFVEDATVHFIWSTNDSNGASITRSTNGTVSVYKDNGTTQSVAGVTDTEDFDSVVGIHACTIDTSADAFYAAGANYTVVLSGATVDSKSVDAVLAHFSIENRSALRPTTDGRTLDIAATGEASANVTQLNGDATAAANHAKAAAEMIQFTVDTATLTPTATQFEADDITEATANHFRDASIVWTSGALKGQRTEITAYALVGGKGRFTVAAMTEAPANDDTGIIV